MLPFDAQEMKQPPNHMFTKLVRCGLILAATHGNGMVPEGFSMGAIELEGECSRRMLVPGASTEAAKTVRFQVRVADCKWSLEIDGYHNPADYSPKDRARMSLVKSMRLGYDGRYLYQVIDYDEGREVARTASTARRVSSVGTVRERDWPDLEFTFVVPIWLSLASDCYLRAKESNPVPFFFSVFSDDLDNQDFFCKTDWASVDGEVKFTSHLQLFGSRFSIYDSTQKRTTISLPADKSALLQLRIPHWMTVGNQKVPRTASLTVNYPVSQDTTVSLIPWCHWALIVTNARVILGAVEFRPRLDEETHVAQDDRLKNVFQRHFTYLGKSNWPEVGSEELSRREKALAGQPESVKPQTGVDRPGFVVVTAFGVMSLILLAIIILLNSKQHNPKNQ